MTKIVTLYFIFLSFCLTAQVSNKLNKNDIKVLQDKITQFEKLGNIKSKDYKIAVNDLATLYFKSGNFSETELLLKKSINIAKENLGVKHMDYAESLYNLASFYNQINDFNKDETLFYEILEIRKENLGEKNIEYINSICYVARIFKNENKFTQAEELFLKAKKLQIEVSGEKDKNYAGILYDLFLLYNSQGYFNKSKDLINEIMSICKEIYGEKTIEYSSSLYALADLYKNHGEYTQAAEWFLKTLEILKDFKGEKSKEYTSTLNHLGLTYREQGRYIEAEPIFKKAIEINREIVGEKDPEYAASINNLGLLYENQGRFLDAEPLYINAIKIIKETTGEKSNYYATFINNLGFLYKNFGKFSQAESIFLEALEIRKNNLGEKNIDYISSLNNLALIYSDEGKSSEAIPLYERSLELAKEILGEKHPYYALILSNLGIVYNYTKEYKKAEPLLLKSVNIKKEVLGEKHNDYADALNNLGLIKVNQGNFNEAEPLFNEAINIYKANLGENNPGFINIVSNLAILYKNQNQYDKVALYYNQFLKLNQTRITEDVFSFSDKELIDYVNFKNINFAETLSILNDINIFNQGININCYNNWLLVKNLSIRNHERIKKSIQNNKNKFLLVKYQRLIENKNEIKKLKELPLIKQPYNLVQLTNETEQIEKELSKESIPFLEYKKGMAITLEDIRSKLKNDDIAVDIITFRYWNKKWTDSIVYSAFIVKKDNKTPKFIPLFEQNQLDFLLSKNKTLQDSIRINKQYTDEVITELFLKPVQTELKGISNIYLSLSGFGHEINFAALPLNQTQTIGDKYKLHILNTTSELIDYKEVGLDQKNKPEILLYGGIDYGKSDVKEKSVNSIDEISEEFFNNITRSGIKGFDYIDGTNTEVNQIQLKANQNGFTTKLLTESAATEESIKQLDGKTSPYVLHLATHGFFFADTQQNELPKDLINFEGKAKVYKTADDPMMRSGLVFAGANNYWSKANKNSSIDDGILTASEISNLDLSACQLVVLSACETGLGEVKGSEGVFGLQRAFKMAGVKNIIMSLWKVPDTQTAELFDIFYSECFAGKTIHEAFQTAQAQMKAKYSPYYWAGFVLLE